MLNVNRADVVEHPFPHALSDQILPPELFARLKQDFPDSQSFEATSAEAGGVGSRAGQGSGFDIYRGDTAYGALIARSKAWAEFDAWVNSPAFVAKYLELFGDFADAMEILADIDPSHYDPNYIEPRDQLTERETFADRVARLSHRATRDWRRTRRPLPLFSRLDITRSDGGYAKKPHCDRPNRLCSLIIYFSDAAATGLEGGELLVYKSRENRPIAKMPRFPDPATVEVAATLPPRENRGIFFPCCNNSYHGVTEIRSRHVNRDFLYINISARGRNIW